MTQEGPILRLEVEVEGERSTFELKPGAAIRVGRKPTSDIHIPRNSVSQDHLEILWTGSQVEIQDLGSKFGTFRLPQDSPFQRAQLPPQYELELRVSKAHMHLRWSLEEANLAEPTEVLASTQVLAAEGGETHSPASPLPLEDVKLDMPRSVEPLIRPQTPAPETVAHRREEKVLLPQGLVAFLSALLFVSILCGVLWPWYRPLGGVSYSPENPGAAYDALIYWWELLARYRFLLGGAFGLWLLMTTKLRLPEGRWKVSRTFAQGLGAISLLLWLGFAMGPVLRFGTQGFRGAQWREAQQLQTLLGTPPTMPSRGENWEPDSEKQKALVAYIESLRGAAPRYLGSSLLFNQLVSVQRAKVLSDCQGQGENAPWEKKKLCLVLLFAVTVEAKEEVHPQLIAEIAARSVILLGLDGLTRVLTAEGLTAPLLSFYLESLQMIGLGKERSEIEGLLPSSSDPLVVRESVSRLIELRHLIEQRLSTRQEELDLPAIFRIEVPGPLETGI